MTTKLHISGITCKPGTLSFFLVVVVLEQCPNFQKHFFFLFSIIKKQKRTNKNDVVVFLYKGKKRLFSY